MQHVEGLPHAAACPSYLEVALVSFRGLLGRHDGNGSVPQIPDSVWTPGARRIVYPAALPNTLYVLPQQTAVLICGAFPHRWRSVPRIPRMIESRRHSNIPHRTK